MKISAKFYDLDDAEFAAAALRRNAEGIYDITIKERPTGAHRDGEFASPGFYMSLSSGSAVSMPVPYITDEQTSQIEDNPKSATMEIICRPSAAKRVSGILISKGGHDLTGRV